MPSSTTIACLYNFSFGIIKNWLYCASIMFFFLSVFQVKFHAKTYTKYLSAVWLGEALNDLWSHLWLPRSSVLHHQVALPLFPLRTHYLYLVWKLKKLQAEHVKNCWVNSPHSSVLHISCQTYIFWSLHHHR